MNTRDICFRSNGVRDILRLFHEELDALYGRGEVAVFAEMLFEAFLGWDRVRLLSSRDETVNQSDLLRFHWALEDLKRHRPIQHIIGHTDFCGCRVRVCPDVLIPRPETEEMVEAIVANMQGSKSLRVMDLCTGSGCIAIALKKAFPEAGVSAVDISPAALAVARENAKDNGTDVMFIQGDVLSPGFRPPFASCNLIVSNPPYVRESERSAMDANVLDYEPRQALFVPDADPLLFYRAIGRLAQGCLAEGGLLAMEINEALSGETAALLHGMGFCTVVHTDFRARARWIAARR
ncbi:MAG: peptide chain release factor N(5)-glutamine methyltransferase [Bacteroidales bacterium]|nr:peptide chain release factor N(5)-glutamine methyltransferase [Bacteroidales bacterium]